MSTIEEKKTEYKTILNCFDTVIRYNGYESIFREIYNEFQKFIEEWWAEKHERWFTMHFDESDKFCYWQVQVLRMMLVEMFGWYWTSPRYWWIEDEKWFGEFMSDLMKLLDK